MSVYGTSMTTSRPYAPRGLDDVLLSLSQAEDAETCDAKDASAGNAAGSAKSLVLPSNAGHLVISVDDLEDRVVEGEAEGPPRSRSAWCQAWRAANQIPMIVLRWVRAWRTTGR